MKYILPIFFLALSQSLQAQMPSPVQWEVELHNEQENSWISLDALMDGDWVVYSQFMSEEGPIPTSFEFKIVGDAKTIGQTSELSPVIKKYSELFEMEVKKFKKEAKFLQKISLIGNGTIEIDVTFMTCSGDKCLPPKTQTYTLKY